MVRFFAAALIGRTGFTAQASSLAAFCTLKDGDGPDTAKIEQFNADKRLPIASVSKVMTGWYIVASKGANYRIPTSFHVTPVENDLYDIHIQGARDPYFGHESLQFAISELNKLGIKKVRRLSFDENFKFFWSVTSDIVTRKHYFNNEPAGHHFRLLLFRK